MVPYQWCSKCSSKVVSIIIPILQMGNWGTKRLRDLSRVKQQVAKISSIRYVFQKLASGIVTFFGMFPIYLQPLYWMHSKGNNLLTWYAFACICVHRSFWNTNAQWAKGVNWKTEVDSSFVMICMFTWHLLGICMVLRKSFYEEVI